MFPLFHFITFFDFLFSIFIGVKVFNSFRREKEENLKSFLGIFLSLAAYFGIISLPGLALNDPVSIQTVYIISYAPLYFSIYFMILIFLNMFRLGKIRILVNLSLSIIGANIVLNVIYFSPAIIRTFGQFYYWGEGTPVWLQAINGIILGLAILFISIKFFREGLKSNEEIVRARALRIGLGSGVFFVLAAINFIHPLYLQEVFYRFLATVAAGALSFAALGLVFSAVYYKPKI